MQACGSLEKTTFGQEREREQKHTTGQKRKQLGKRSPVQVEQKKKRPLLMRCSYIAAQSGALWTSTDVVASNWPSVTREKRRDELHRAAPPHHVVCCSHTLNTSLLRVVHSPQIRLGTTSSEIRTGAKSCNVRLLRGMWTHRGDVAKKGAGM